MSSRLQEEQYGGRIGRIARGAGVGMFGQGTWRMLNYATQIALAWMYGPAQLGLYVLGITAVQMANVLAQFGMDNGVVRYVAHYRAQGDVPRVRGTVLVALSTTFALSVVLAVAMFFGAGFLAGEVFGKPSLTTMFEVFSASLPLLTAMNMALFATQGFQNVRYTTYVQHILQPLMNFALVGIFYLMGVQVVGAAVAYVVSMLAGSLLALYYLKGLFPKPVDGEWPTRFEAWKLFNASWPLTVFSVTQRINNWTAVLVLGIFSTASAVGIYNAAARMAEFSVLLLFAFNTVFSPMISDLYGKRRLSELSRLYRDVSRWVFTGALAVFIVTVLLGRDVLLVLGPEFVVGYAVLVVIAAAQLFNSSVGPTQRVLAMTCHQKVLMSATAGSAAVGVAVNFALVPVYGIMGAAAATAIATILANTVTLFYVRRLLGVWPYSPWYAKPLTAGLLTGAAVYAIRLSFPISPGVEALLVLGPLCLIAPAVLLFVMGISPGDRQLLASLRAKVGGTGKRRAG